MSEKTNIEWATHTRLVKNGDKNAFPTWIAALSVRGSGGKLNAEAIVAFRNALPALLAESKRTASLEADCQRLRGALGEVLEWMQETEQAVERNPGEWCWDNSGELIINLNPKDAA